MSKLFAGKVALVTGGDKDIGAEVGKALVRAGVSVLAISYRTDTYATNTVIKAIKEITDADRTLDLTAFALKGDITDPKRRKFFFECLDRELNACAGNTKVDILVNCAGLRVNAGTPEAPDYDPFPTPEKFVEALSNVTEQVLERMPNGGRIINITNGFKRDAFGDAAHVATRRAIEQITVPLSERLQSRGITVNAISPGPLNTTDKAWMRKSGGGTVSAIEPLAQLGTPEGIARAVVELALPDYKYTRGTTLFVQQSLTAHP